MKIASLDKSLRIIALLSENPRGLSLSAISEKLRIPNSTAHHILSTFLSHGYISKDPQTRKYSLGFKFVSISKIILENLDVRRIAHDHLVKLHERCRESVFLAVLRDGKIAYIDRINYLSGLSLATNVGFTTEPHATAGGKVLLSGLSRGEIERIYRSRRLRRYGKNTITALHDLFNELKKVRKQGYAIDDEEYYEGVRCVGAPIRAGGKIVAALSITGSVFSMTMDRINEELIGLAVDTAEKISSEMKW
ncbi:MAG: IclR family transcriptional regulator [Deltaproteobacteria bacterium]|nr:IclR family transcriptional regulator [Deltaproteobacteria bacterium]MBW2127343.1 IclR family transcriptional regulator [Deltaproteobacteria bacterium]